MLGTIIAIILSLSPMSALGGADMGDLGVPNLMLGPPVAVGRC